MRLLRYTIGGFRSYHTRQTLTLDDLLTFVVGRNDVGKSALLRGLLFPTESQDGARADLTATYVWRVGQSEMLAHITDSVETEGLRAAISQHDAVDVEAHFMIVTGTRKAPEFGPAALNVADGLFAPALTHGGDGTNFEWKIANSNAPELRVLAAGLAEWVTQQAQLVVYVGPRRVDRGRQGLTYGMTRLEPDARNLTSVLFYLHNNFSTTVWRDLQAFIREAFPDIDSIAVPLEPDQNAPMGEPAIYYNAQIETPVPLQHCGSGVEQLLGLAVAVMTAPANQLFLIDEPQAYLHPHAERSLLKLIAANTQHQYLIATHSGFLLAANALSQGRLITMVERRSVIADAVDAQALLGELGVTARDLWLSDGVLWVEGPSEEAAFARLLSRAYVRADIASLTVKRMPDGPSQLVSRRGNQARAIYEFCEGVVSAVSPLPVEMRFLFDRDEKTPETRTALAAATGDRARFLPVRELENLFLAPDAVHSVLEARCNALNRDVPTPEDVISALDTLLAAQDDTRLFPGGPTDEPVVDVRGSRVLSELFWDLAQSEYDKVRDGAALTEAILATHPEALEPLRNVLAELLSTPHQLGS